MSDELSQRVEADIAEIMERTGFEDPRAEMKFAYASVMAELVAALRPVIEQAVETFTLLGRAMGSGLANGLQRFEPTFANTTRVERRAYRSLGLLDYPPQHNYRQTKRGRVPRLTPTIRAKKRELRERRGR